MEIIDEIKFSPLFHEMNDKEIKKILADSSVHKYSKGDKIFVEGEDGHSVYVMLEGEATVQKKVEDHFISLTSIKRGDVFGEQALLNSYKRSAQVEADMDCFILAIENKSVMMMYKKDPKVFGLLFLNISKMLIEKIRITSDLLSQAKEDLALMQNKTGT